MNEDNQNENLNNSNIQENIKSKKEKIVPAYEKKDTPVDKKTKKNKDKKKTRSKITIIFLVLLLVIVGVAVYGIISLINYTKHKPYKQYEEKMKNYGFDKTYNNGSANTGDSITKSEAIKMVLAASFNTNDISGFAKEPEGDNNYDNAIWVEYAKFRGIITDSDINKDNYKDKAKYIDVIRYLATAKIKILERELDSAVQLKVKDFEKYKSDEQVAIEDMIQNEIITVNTKKINGNRHIFKGQMNELISNFVEKYNTITVNGEKININEDKMPSNKDEYPYTLASVDKSVYEKKFFVDDEENFLNPKELYTTKKEYYSQIKEITEGYYDLILNIDYNTINYERFAESLREYSLYGINDNYINEYIEYVKKNRIILKGKSTVMFPAVYYDGLQYGVRVKLDFEVVNSNTEKNLLYLDLTYGKDVTYKSNKLTIYIDAKLGNTLSGFDNVYVNDLPIISNLIEDNDKVE